MSKDPKDEETAYLGDLVVQIARRASLTELIGKLHAALGEKGLKEVLDELERVLTQRIEALPPPPAGTEEDSSAPRAALPEAEVPAPAPIDATRTADRNDRTADGTLHGSPDQPVPPAVSDRPAAPSVAADRENEDVPAPGSLPVTGPPAQIDRKAEEGPVFTLPESPFEKPQHVRIPYQFDEEDFVYLHGVSIVPLGESSEPRPFMLEEKGIEGREFAFALDHGGLRFFLSRIASRTANVNRSGVLLLNRQESLRLRGVHESILNDLRAHGVVLPFEFGTVARGKDELMARLDEHLFDLHDAVDDLLATTEWTLTVNVLDARFAQIIGGETSPTGRERERERRSTLQAPTSSSKLDIKMLERILGREKKLAEAIHDELKKIADRSDVTMIVGFSSGTTDEWKPILKAAYEVPPSRVHQLNRAIRELQYRHFLFELMLALRGDREPYSFQKS